MKFYGREKEIGELRKEREISHRFSRFTIVTGRRRIGKTYLIRNYFKDKFTFYHTGVANVGFRDQLLGFRDSLRDYGRECPLPKTWREAFRELRSLIETSADAKKVVFIDVMPWMDTPRSKFLPSLEHFWNSWGSSRRDLVMVVCGSASSTPKTSPQCSAREECASRLNDLATGAAPTTQAYLKRPSRKRG